MMRHSVAMMMALAALAACCQAYAEETLQILPGEFTLAGPQARQTLLVERMSGDIAAGQVTDGVTFESSDSQVVGIEDGRAVPAGNGTATITARAGGETATAAITVSGMDQPHRWSFRNHVQSVLSKMGCNSGACHGAAAGKNGFRLSLRGYDPEFDFFSITRQSRGRRVVPDDPGRSLLLTKPSGAIPHKGGLRFQPDSREYRVLAEWIAAGHPGPAPEDPRLERLEILPTQAALRPQETQQLVVRAHFSDGRAEDVTRWAKFTSTNATVANVSEDGQVSVIGHGEGAVVAWYLSQNVVAHVTVPHEQSVAGEFFANAGRGNFIDDLVQAKLRELNIPPSPPASDAEFLRRAFLDTVGVLPTVEEARAFLADDTPGKRERLVDTLLERPEFVDYWTYKWSDLLLLSGERLRPQALDTFYYWIRQQVEQNTPWDVFVREIVTAKGSTFENGAANFYSLHQDPLDMAETTSMAFLGMSIQCARCHDHPLEKWTNDQYYGMANLFARTRGKGWGGDFRGGDGKRVIFTVEDGELIQPRTGRPQPPRPLDAEPIPLDDPRDRREYLADWLTSPENAYFSRAIANRVWANFFGVGIVEAVDDMRLTNPPSNEQLLAALAESLIEHDYDLKQLMRLILTAKTYQRSSLPVTGNESDERFYSRYYPKRLPAEVVLDALSAATAAPTQFPGYDPGTRALQLRDASVDSYFLETFGRPERLLTCECERSNDPSMKQILHITNGDTLNEKLSRKADAEKKLEDNRIGQLLARGASNAEIVEEAYLASLSRYPTEDERAAVLQVLDAAPAEERRLVIEDLFWSLLSGKAFLFNH